MLKRRREPSPSPLSAPSPDAFSLPHTTLMDEDERVVSPFPKRRRTQAPVLDSIHRGWATSQTGPDIPFDDAEEDDMSAGEEPRASPDTTADYSSVNSLLHDLHQQRRMLAQTHTNSTARSNPVPALYSGTSGPFQLGHEHHAVTAHAPATPRTKLGPDWFHSHQRSSPSQRQPFATPAATTPLFDQSEETKMVTQQYEDANRCAYCCPQSSHLTSD